MYGRMYNNTMANIAFGFLFIGFNLLYFPQFIIGMMGMPRRYFDYLPQFTFGHQLSTIGGWILFVGIVIMLVNLFNRKGMKATSNPWGGRTLEWTIPSPPPTENFDVMPEFGKDDEPYDYK